MYVCMYVFNACLNWAKVVQFDIQGQKLRIDALRINNIRSAHVYDALTLSFVKIVE